MTTLFDPTYGLIVVRTVLAGPKGRRRIRLALDTGATRTMINTALLAVVGYDPGVSADRVEVTTGSGVEYVPLVDVAKIHALGEDREHLAVVAHTLPPSASVDGVLGLDFFRGRELNIDFRQGLITVR